MTTVFTNGVFDLLHPGHMHLLTEAVKMGRLVVGVNDDASARRLKGPERPRESVWTRMNRVWCVPGVAEVRIFGDGDLEALIREVKPDVLVKGDDYRLEDVVGRDLVARVVLIPRLPGYSTTAQLGVSD